MCIECMLYFQQKALRHHIIISLMITKINKWWKTISTNCNERILNRDNSASGHWLGRMKDTCPTTLVTHIDILSVGGGRAEGQVNNRCDVVTRCYDIWRHSTIVWPATVTPCMKPSPGHPSCSVPPHPPPHHHQGLCVYCINIISDYPIHTTSSIILHFGSPTQILNRPTMSTWPPNAKYAIHLQFLTSLKQC